MLPGFLDDTAHTLVRCHLTTGNHALRIELKCSQLPHNTTPFRKGERGANGVLHWQEKGKGEWSDHTKDKNIYMAHPPVSWM